MRVRIKKIWQGRWASIRSDRVQKAIEKGEGIRVQFEDQHMDLTLEELLKGRSLVGTSFQSQYNRGQKYRLIDYLWLPNKEKSKNRIGQEPEEAAFLSSPA